MTFFFFRNIPSVDEAWQLPIPAELTTRTIRNAQVRPAMGPLMKS